MAQNDAGLTMEKGFLIIPEKNLDELADICAYTDYERSNRLRFPLLVLGLNFMVTGILSIFLYNQGHSMQKWIPTVLCLFLGTVSIIVWWVLGRGNTYKKCLEIRKKQMQEQAYKCRVNAEIAIMEQDLNNPI
jgi:hypothetical protein